MTLDTHVAITAPVSAREVIEFMRPLVNTPEGVEPTTRGNEIWNPGGIGANAWLIVYHGPDDGAQVIARADGADNDEDPDERDYYALSPHYNGTSYVVVSMDTAYGYRGDGGESCSDLHARLVTALGQWLDAREIPWKWRNEYTGEWFDRYDQLDTFGDAHRATGADEWFRTRVLPAIATEYRIDEVSS